MSITLELSPEIERRLEEEAARQGQAPSEYARLALEEKLAAAARRKSNREAIALLEQWMAESPDPGEEAGYPLAITPLSLREISVD